VDCPACCHGLSAPAPRTVRPLAVDCPLKQTEPPEATSNKGPSAGSTRTVRHAPADCPLGTHGPSETSPNQNSKTPWIENKGEQEHEEHAHRGPSATSSRTDRALRTEQKTARPRRSTPPIHHRISQTVEAVETKVWGHHMCQPRMLYPKNFAS
jgi:hypothetical protein